MSLTYLIGEPGVGKSTVMVELLREEGAPHAYAHPFSHSVLERRSSIHLGNPNPKNPQHPGTDTLSYNVLPKACQWLPTLPNVLTVYGEGDRLAHPRLWEAMEREGHDVAVFLLLGPADERRAHRGTHQNPTWLAGRASRVRNLSSTWPVIPVDTSDLTPASVAGLIRQRLTPAR